METYYQESGRAGRDGLPSECVLYYRPGDVPRQSSMVFYENCGLQNLYDIVRYCQTKRRCRRNAIFQHFGEAMQDCNGMCDNCAYNSELKEIDATDHSKIIVSLLQDMQANDQRATLLQLVEKFKAKQKDLGRSNKAAAELKKEETEQLIIQLILDRVLREEFQHTAYATNAYVALGPLWKQALQGKRPVRLEIRVNRDDRRGSPKGAKRSRTSVLETKLDDLRREISSSNGGIFPHAVLSTQQITLLSTKRPTAIAELEKLIGKVKAEKYGNRIVELIQHYINSEPNARTATAENGSNKRQKKDKAVVCVESSEDER